ncbi:auxin efflux carrier [Lipomyces kononenkoae]|uniref:Auxin efflux carrier n=1 Tax=Lipomyces kononenkoae TaxID=34357 RepID=A0ACC3T8Q1_LIPKO
MQFVLGSMSQPLLRLAPEDVAGAAATEHTHPSYALLSFLVFQAVVQVVLVCVLGFWAAHVRLLNPALQKHISQLNVNLFTPCLIFVKLASAITADKLVDLAIIPVLFVLTTGVSYVAALVINRIQGFSRRESNFVIAMAVFANSNSLPVSLTIALAQTLPTLKWLPDDTSDMVASRGILYLLIFQQLGQMLRWSWGYNTLLSKDDGSDNITLTSARISVSNDSDDEAEEVAQFISRNVNSDLSIETIALSAKQLLPEESSSDSSSSSDVSDSPTASLFYNSDQTLLPSFNRSYRKDFKRSWYFAIVDSPRLAKLQSFLVKLMNYMNPPLWAMISALIVASITPLQRLLFEDKDTFIYRTFTSAVTQTSQVSVPLILVVLGGNLYPDDGAAPPSPHFKRIVASSLVARMLISGMVLIPILAVFAKFVHLSIVDDPIFLVVLFLLATAPPAIQLSQICQLNEVFEREMSAVLFWGYVVLTLPVTMVMVVMSLEVLEWAGRLPSV